MIIKHQKLTHKKLHLVERVNGEVKLCRIVTCFLISVEKKNHLIINLIKDYLKPLWMSPQLKTLPTSLIKLKVTMISLGEILTE